MNTFSQTDQNEIRSALEDAVIETLETDTTSVRVISSVIEFSALQPVGMGVVVRMSLQINPYDVKETPAT